MSCLPIGTQNVLDSKFIDEIKRIEILNDLIKFDFSFETVKFKSNLILLETAFLLLDIIFLLNLK